MNMRNSEIDNSAVFNQVPPKQNNYQNYHNLTAHDTVVSNLTNDTVDNNDNISLLYAKTINGQAPSTLGTVDNGPVDSFGWQNNIIGFSKVSFATNDGPNLQGALMMHGNREHDDNLILSDSRIPTIQ